MNSPVTPNTMSNIIVKYIIITFSIVNSPYPCHPYMFLTKNYSSKFAIMSFWTPALKSPAENGIPKNFLIRHCLFKVNSRNTRKRYEICSKLTIKTSERCK